jgi:isopropylmalate/homocitrate/citramalate synthase
MTLPLRVTVYEVGPRDGLQNVPQVVPTEAKVAFIDALSAAGLPAVEATSFVSPRWVPQLADAAGVMAGITRRPGVRYPVLVPNEKGLDAAIASGAQEVAVFTAASETFNLRNVNASIAESIERFRPVAARALASGLRLRGYVSTAFGCPYQGDIPLDHLLRVVGLLFDLGCHEVSVGDTIGVADPVQVARSTRALAERFDLGRVALHLHDTYGRGLSNVMAGLAEGVTTFDSSAGGLGGCPYAPGAAGNLPTEDLVALLDRLGVETGVDVTAVAAAAATLARMAGLTLPSRAHAALRAAAQPTA